MTGLPPYLGRMTELSRECGKSFGIGRMRSDNMNFIHIFAYVSSRMCVGCDDVALRFGMGIGGPEEARQLCAESSALLVSPPTDDLAYGPPTDRSRLEASLLRWLAPPVIVMALVAATTACSLAVDGRGPTIWAHPRGAARWRRCRKSWAASTGTITGPWRRCG